MSDLQDGVRELTCEVECRIEHGADSKGHLEYVLKRLRALALRPGAGGRTVSELNADYKKLKADWDALQHHLSLVDYHFPELELGNLIATAIDREREREAKA